MAYKVSPTEIFSANPKSKLNLLFQQSLKKADQKGKLCFESSSAVDITEATIALVNWELEEFSGIYDFRDKNKHPTAPECLSYGLNKIYRQTINKIRQDKVEFKLELQQDSGKLSLNFKEDIKYLLDLFVAQVRENLNKFCPKEIVDVVIDGGKWWTKPLFGVSNSIESKAKDDAHMEFMRRLSSNVVKYCTDKYEVSSAGEILEEL